MKLIKLINHNKYNSRLQLRKIDCEKLGLKDGDKVKVTKLEDGKFLVEKEIK